MMHSQFTPAGFKSWSPTSEHQAMIIGTSYFTSLVDAQRYYSGYTSNSVDTVARKLMSGEIHLGRPELRAGEKLLVIDNGCRYAIETA